MRRFSQKTADFRRKPQKTAGTRRKPQIGVRPLRFVPLSAALEVASPRVVAMLLGAPKLLEKGSPPKTPLLEGLQTSIFPLLYSTFALQRTFLQVRGSTVWNPPRWLGHRDVPKHILMVQRLARV